MKKALFFLVIAISAIATAQINDPYKQAELLLNKKVRVVPMSPDIVPQGYTGFFTDKKMYNRYEEGPGFTNKVEALQNKEFTVTEVVFIKENYWGREYHLTLRGENGAPNLYYKYNNKLNRYPFEVEGGLTVPHLFFLDYITIVNDYEEFETYTYVGPYIDVMRRMYKNTKGERDNTILVLTKRTWDKEARATHGPVVIYLEDGTTIKRDKAELMFEKGKYKVIITPKENELDKLSAYKITRFTVMGDNMYSNNKTYSTDEAEVLRGVIREFSILNYVSDEDVKEPKN